MRFVALLFIVPHLINLLTLLPKIGMANLWNLLNSVHCVRNTLTEKELTVFANCAGSQACLKYKSFKLSTCNSEPGTYACAVFLGRTHLSMVIEKAGN
jgi:hypothetical protein